MDSNPRKKDSIPFEELSITNERGRSQIRIPSTVIQIQESREVKNT